MSSLNDLNINIPETTTKQLKIQNSTTGKKIVVSTNWLPLFGFEANARIIQSSLGKNKGISIKLANTDDKKTTKVYTRTYKSRKNNPIETQLDLRSQKLLNESFPEDCIFVHITFTYGEIKIIPMQNKKAAAINQFKKTKHQETFLACSSGVDGLSMVKKGFKIETLLEYRPNEKRDKKDLSETGALNAISNFDVKHLINEDIMNLDLTKIASICSKSNYCNATLSLQCDDFTNVKADSLKEKSIEDGSTTIDMVIDAINIIDKFNFPTILIENVPNFFKTNAGDILYARLKRLGYRVFKSVFNARDFNGLTNRERGYLFATLLPADFNMPSPISNNIEKLWNKYIEPKISNNELRDVSSTKTIKAAIETKRIRVITRDSIYSPTILKSQNRQAKDSIYIYDSKRNKYYFPSNELLAQLMGIEMNFNSVSSTIESEIIGQSIEVPLHEKILDEINKHITQSTIMLKGRLF